MHRNYPKVLSQLCVVDFACAPNFDCLRGKCKSQRCCWSAFACLLRWQPGLSPARAVSAQVTDQYECYFPLFFICIAIFHLQDTETYFYPALPNGVEITKVPVNWQGGRDVAMEAVAQKCLELLQDKATIVPCWTAVSM